MIDELHGVGDRAVAGLFGDQRVHLLTNPAIDPFRQRRSLARIRRKHRAQALPFLRAALPHRLKRQPFLSILRRRAARFRLRAAKKLPSARSGIASAVLSTNQAPIIRTAQVASDAVPTPLRLKRRLLVLRQIQSVSIPPTTPPIRPPASTIPCKSPEFSTDMPRVF